jgi:phospholipid transport system substrate-binding protein
MIRLFARSVAFFALLVSVLAHAQEAPDALVRKAVDEVLSAIKQTKDQKKLQELAEAKVLPYFDFKEMTRLAAGRSWSQANASQQEALEKGFRTLLVRTYTAALTRTSGEAKVDVRPTAASGDDAVVRTVATEPGRQPVQIDYRMAKTAGGWKVYDVIVENLSLVTSYRSSFQSEIARSGVDGLIKTIEDRNRKGTEG